MFQAGLDEFLDMLVWHSSLVKVCSDENRMLGRSFKGDRQGWRAASHIRSPACHLFVD